MCIFLEEACFQILCMRFKSKFVLTVFVVGSQDCEHEDKLEILKNTEKLLVLKHRALRVESLRA